MPWGRKLERALHIVFALIAVVWVLGALLLVLVHATGSAKSETRGAKMVQLRKGDVDVLARTLYGEARGEKRAGMEAVAWVILNRAKRGAPRFPSTISEVCKQRYQFTCWSENDPNAKLCAAVHEGDPHYLLALNVATAVLGGMVADPTKSSDHYFVTKMPSPPEWRKKMELQAIIGAHSFYRETPAK
jgi:N-acetylmuramoyl-L-alanine amidase